MFDTEDNIVEIIKNLPYKKKHQLVTAFIAPEDGGKIIIRYPRRKDLFSGSVEMEEPFWIDRSNRKLKLRMNADVDHPPSSKFL